MNAQNIMGSITVPVMVGILFVGAVVLMGGLQIAFRANVQF